VKKCMYVYYYNFVFFFPSTVLNHSRLESNTNLVDFHRFFGILRLQTICLLFLPEGFHSVNLSLSNAVPLSCSKRRFEIIVMFIFMLERAEKISCFLVQQSLGQGWHQTIPHHHSQGRLHGTEPHANTQVISFLIFLTMLTFLTIEVYLMTER
jgi:hypothetical protein